MGAGLLTGEGRRAIRETLRDIGTCQSFVPKTTEPSFREKEKRGGKYPKEKETGQEDRGKGAIGGPPIGRRRTTGTTPTGKRKPRIRRAKHLRAKRLRANLQRKGTKINV